MMSADAATYAGRVVVVTGASRGLGRLLAEYFLAQEARVVGVSRGESDLIHPDYEHHVSDIADDRAVRELFVAIARSQGRVDIVINNAAVLTSIHAMLMPATRAEEMVRTNLLGGLFVAREAAKVMRKRSFGRIIGIGSMASTLEPVGDSVYAATKAASMTLTGVLAKEFAGYGITVNMVSVSALETDMLRQLPRERVDAVVAGLPLPRLATADDIFNVIDFFASVRSSYITAQTVFLGGIHA
jgi:3-oxoacyl-[acyl-carrier protein] reductase